MANQFLIKNTMADMRGLSVCEIVSLQGTTPTYAGVELLGYYEKGDTPTPIKYYLSTTSNFDDGGSVVEVRDIKLEHTFVDEVDGEYFGMRNTNINNSSIAQTMVYYSVKAKINRINFPVYFRFKYSEFIIPNNLSIKHYGNTNEEKIFYNNINANGTPVNEMEIVSGFHTGFILDNHDYIVPEILESFTKRSSSIVMRQNGFSSWQEHFDIFGKHIHDYNYRGIADILVTSGAKSDGVLVFKLNGVEYSVNILSTDTELIIRDKILGVNFDSYFTYKTISGQTVRVFPKEHTAIIIRAKATSNIYPVTIEGQIYNIPVLLTDSMTQIAQKIATSPLIPSEKYYKYQQGVRVAVYNKLGGANVSTSISVISNNTGAVVSTSVTAYINQYNALTITSSGTSRPKVGMGMWSARNYTLEVADTFKVIADSDNNNTSGAEAIIGWENETANVRKLFKLRNNGELEVLANDSSTKIFGFNNAGHFYANRFQFLNTSRFIGQANLGEENAVYISNNTGTAYTLRMSDANGIEYNKGGVWKPYLTTVANASSAVKGLVNQATASADTATGPSSTYSQSEMEGILTELRDLKNKMRVSGMLAS